MERRVPSPKGKSAKSEPAPAIPPEQCSFEFFFRPIFKALGELYMHDLPARWWRGAHEDPELTIVRDALDPTVLIPPRTFFPHFGRYVGEGDWIDLFFFKDQCCTPLDFERWRFDRDRFLSLIHTWFRNVDGAYWLLFSRDVSMLDAVREHMASMPGFCCRPERLHDDS